MSEGRSSDPETSLDHSCQRVRAGCRIDVPTFLASVRSFARHARNAGQSEELMLAALMKCLDGADVSHLAPLQRDDLSRDAVAWAIDAYQDSR